MFFKQSPGSVLRYYILVAALFVLNYGLLQLMGKIGIALWLAQIIAQLVIYPLSFVIQRKFVFARKIPQHKNIAVSGGSCRVILRR